MFTTMRREGDGSVLVRFLLAGDWPFVINISHP